MTHRWWFGLLVAASLARCETTAPAVSNELEELDAAYLDFSTLDNDSRLSCFHVATPVATGYSRRNDCLSRLQRAEESAATSTAR